MKKRIKIVVIILVIAIIVGIIGIFLLKNKENKNIEYTIDEVQQYSYYVVRENNKYGVIGRNGEKVIEADYDNVKIPNPEKDVFICYKDGKSMVLNSNAETILGEFQQVEPIRLKNVVSDLMYEKSVLIYEKDGKYGLVDFGGKKITENIYEEIDTLSSQEGKLIVKKDGKVGIININGYEIIKCNYDKIDIDGYYQEDGGYKYAGYIISNTTEEGYRYGYVNYKGEMIVEPECNQLSRVIDIEDKENAYLILAKNGQYGVFKNDKELIESEYQSIDYEKENEVFIIEKSGIYGVVNLKSETVLPLEYNQIDITGICIYATKGEETKTYDKFGQEMNIDTNTSILNTNSDKYQICLVNGEGAVLYGVIDKSGKELVPKEYHYVEYLFDKYFIVSNDDGRLGVIDDNNNKVIEVEYTSLQRIEGTDIVQAVNTEKGVTEFYSKDMNKICETSKADVSLKGDYIYAVNEEGTIYINVKTQKEEKNTEVFKENTLFAKKENNVWGFVNSNGEVKVDYQYEKVTEFNEEGFAGVKKDGKWGIIDKEGKMIVEPIYVIQDENKVDFLNKYYRVEYGDGEIYYTNEINEDIKQGE